MRHALLVLALVALAAPLAATGEEAAPVKSAGTVLAVETARGGDYLVRVSRESLRPVSRRLALGGHAYAWSRSPDGRRLAVGIDRPQGVRIIDLRRMKRVRTIPTWGFGGIRTLAWVAPRRIVGWEFAGLFLLDPAAARPLPSPQSSGDVVSVARAGSRLVLITAPVQEVGPARVAVVGADGAVRTIQLDRIRAGESETTGESYRPALVIDPAGRAFVAGTQGEPIAELRLESLELTYHEPTEARSLLARFRNWLEPAAQAKVPLAGSSRSGAWLGDGRLAVWGLDTVRLGPDRAETTPSGLQVVDTNDWTVRTIDANAWHAAFAGSTLLASYRRGGLTAFDPSGFRRYHLFDGEPLGVVATFESRAFVAFDHKPMHVLDVSTGRVLGTRRTYPRLLDATFSGW